MTFYEAAIHVLEREGKQMTSQAITEIALKENLLSHVGKEPEVTMETRLLAMARRKGERRILVTGPSTYALVEWGTPEDPLAASAPEPAPAPATADAQPLRPSERHPEIDSAKVRVLRRGERPHRKRRPERGERPHERGERRRRLPPLAEVAFEVLSQAGEPLTALDVAAAARERGLVTEDLGAETLVNAMEEENRRRTAAGRQPVFVFAEDGTASVSQPAPGEAPPVELQAAFASALGMPLRPEEARPASHPKGAGRGPGATRVITQAQEHRRHIARLVRRRLNDLELEAFTEACVQLLRAADFRDLRAVRRESTSSVITARRREGSLDVRYAVRVVPGGREVAREEVAELKRDVTGRSAQMGMLLCAGEVTREARHEASAPVGPVVFLWCGEALAEQFMERRVGASVLKVEVWDTDDDFFRACRDRGRQAKVRAESGRQSADKPSEAVEAPPPDALPIPLTQVVGEAPTLPTPPGADAQVPPVGAQAAPSPGELAAGASPALSTPDGTEATGESPAVGALVTPPPASAT